MPRKLPYYKMDLSREGILWFAGLFEGEGSLSFSISKKTGLRSWVMRINMTDFDVIERVHSMFGGSKFEKSMPPNCTHKPALVWTTSKLGAIYALCAAMIPFMGKRRREKMEMFIQDFATRHLSHNYQKLREKRSEETKQRIKDGIAEHHLRRKLSLGVAI